MLELLRNCNGLEQYTQISELSDDPVVRILFDESHDELLRAQAVPDDDEVDTWSRLAGDLRDLDFDIFPDLAPGKRRGKGVKSSELVGKKVPAAGKSKGVDLSQDKGDEQSDVASTSIQTGAIEEGESDDAVAKEATLIQNLKNSKDPFHVLVLGAPRKPLDQDEVDAIADFVHRGGSLLIAHSYESLWWQDKNGTPSTVNRLLESFGLNIKQLLNWTTNTFDASHLRPHYLSSAVNRLVVKEPTYLEKLNKVPYVAATLPDADKPFLAAVEADKGRVVVIGDFAIFGDRYIHRNDNRALALNVFRWLARVNSLDFHDAHFDREVRYGQTAIFSIVLENSHRQRLEHVSCLLESDASALILNPLQQIRSLPAYSKTQLQWVVEPRRLGAQNLRLTVDFEKSEHDPLFLDSVAKFACVPDAEIELVFLNRQDRTPGVVETGVPFDVQARVRWADGAKPVPLRLDLKQPLAHVAVEAMEQTDEARRWRLTALDAGDWTITLEAEQLNQKITRLVHALPSIQDQIRTIDRDVIMPLEAEIRLKMSQLRREFDVTAIQHIPFRLLTPEAQVRLLEPAEEKEHLLEVIQAARVETFKNRPLVEELLLSLAPTHSSVHGCCIPYDPKLASHLVDNHASYEENLAYNLAGIDGDDRYGPVWLQQNTAALLLHEKYGHGFFFTQTTLGRQMAILEHQGLVPDANETQHLKSSYLRNLYEQYKEVLTVLYHSAITVNEGFATWVELTILPQLGGVVGQAAYRRRDFLFNRNNGLTHLAEYSPYFQVFKPWRSSKYQEGCELLELIQGYFGSDCGPKCAVQAAIKAADVDMGISENNGQVRFGLKPHEMAEVLLDAEGNDARAGMRLRDIHQVLREHSGEIREEQKTLQCHRSCLHSECPVNKMIGEKLKW